MKAVHLICRNDELTNRPKGILPSDGEDPTTPWRGPAASSMSEAK